MGWIVGKLVLAGVLLATGGVVAAPGASAQGERRGNWDLYVDAGGCAYDWQEQAWCGPSLVVHADLYLTDADRYFASMRLIGPNGDIPLQYGANARYSPGRGSSKVDPSYWGPAFEKRTPTGGLAPGRYGVTLTADVMGRWSCSIYSENICNFLQPKEVIYAWTFDWTGTSVQVPTVKLVREVEASVVGRNSGKPEVWLNAAVQPDTEGTRVTIQRQVSAGKWKTIATRKSGGLGLVSYIDKKPPKAKTVRYRLFVPGAQEFALTVTARTK